MVTPCGHVPSSNKATQPEADNTQPEGPLPRLFKPAHASLSLRSDPEAGTHIVCPLSLKVRAASTPDSPA